MAAPATTPLDDLPAILVTDLDYKAGFFGPLILHGIDLNLPQGSRCLLCGANGSGKSTLLQVLGGKHMVPEGGVRVLGRPAFHDLDLTTAGELAYLGAAWRTGTLRDAPLKGDLSAEKLIYGVAGADPARRDRLVKLLDIDLSWRMLTASDGQRRRVQIAMGLLMPYKVLLLDEITVDMDVLGRLDLLRFFKQECEERGASIVYATHIFDGLEGWPTHVAYMERGALVRCGALEDFPELASCGRLLTVVEDWLRQEKTARRGGRIDADGDPAAGRQGPGIIVNDPVMPNKHLAWFR